VESALGGVRRIWSGFQRFVDWAYAPRELVRGLLIYSAGDTVATLIQGSFSVTRVLGVMCVGGFIYSFEIPRYFRWLETLFVDRVNFPWRCVRAAAAMAYFNPIWIARHYLFLSLFLSLSSGAWPGAYEGLAEQAVRSFVVLAPFSLLGNYFVQNCLLQRWRFTASAIMSGLFAIGYAVLLR